MHRRVREVDRTLFDTGVSPFSIGSAMIGRGKRVLLRHYLEQGMTKAAIARQVGVSRDTIYRWTTG